MNTDSGTFDLVPPEPPKHFQRVSIGEVVLLKGKHCEVLSIEERSITLKLLSTEERLARGNRHQRRAEMLRLRTEEKESA